MTLEKYGIKLHRLTIDKIELVRNWRNDPKISQHMFYREYITPEMQVEWFNKINNEHNYYFIIEYNNEEIGLSNVKNIDFEKKCGEVGLFIYEDKYRGSDVSTRVSFCTNDFLFEKLNLEYIYANIAASNKTAIRYNKNSTKIEYSDDGMRVLVMTTKNDYYKFRNKYARILERAL